jgi:hypothetical protein
MAKPPQMAPNAVIAFEGATITRVRNHTGEPQYDGIVTFHASTGDTLEFKYSHQFYGVSTVHDAIVSAAEALKSDLDQLSAAIEDIQYVR